MHIAGCAFYLYVQRVIHICKCGTVNVELSQTLWRGHMLVSVGQINQKGENKMKKTLALILALCMIFALCACGQSAQTAAPAADESPAADAAPSAGGEKRQITLALQPPAASPTSMVQLLQRSSISIAMTSMLLLPSLPAEQRTCTTSWAARSRWVLLV